jgi:hypothetical protein
MYLAASSSTLNTLFQFSSRVAGESSRFSSKIHQCRSLIRLEDWKELEAVAKTAVDLHQFEEFFFAYPDLNERRAFYTFLQACLNLPYVKVILSLRDYLETNPNVSESDNPCGMLR